MEEYKQYYKAAHDFHARWVPCPANDDEWQECSEDYTRTAQQCDRHPFAISLLVGVYKELERVFLEKNGDDDSE